MLSAKSSAASLFFSPESSCISVTEFEENHTPKHNYYTRSSVRRSSASYSTLSLPSVSSKRSRLKVSLPTAKKVKVPLANIDKIKSFFSGKMDWTYDRCRPSPFVNVSKYLIAAICIGAVGFMLTFLNAKFQEHRQSYNQMKDELTCLQNEINSIKEVVKSAEKSKTKTGENLSKIQKTIEDLKNSTISCRKPSKDGKGESGDGSSSDGNEEIEKIVTDMLDQYDSDKTGKIDFALESAGGSIVSSRGTENYMEKKQHTLLGFTICETSPGPRAIIQANVLPGECWAIKGAIGSAVIRLLGKIYVTGVSLEHIPKKLSPTGQIDTAPREFSIWGLNDPAELDGQFFGQFSYDADGPRLQYFEIPDVGKSYQYVEFKVHSNHGNPEYTCIYRLRVHGNLEHLRKGTKV